MSLIWLYVPNLIGYARIIFMFLAFYYAETNPYVFFICYSLSQTLDMFDGMAARAFNQSTKFGAMLDMVTDRCSDIGLMVVLAQRYPEWTLYCHAFIWIDICSHWAHMLAQLQSGATSHKNVSSGPWLLRFYYSCHNFMVLLIMGAEGFPLSLYLLSHEEFVAPVILKAMHYMNYGLAPLFFTKHFINIIQFVHAAEMLDHPQTESNKKD